MEAKSSSVQGSQRKNFSKSSFGASTRAYVINVKEYADLPKVITGIFSFLGNNIYALIDLGSTHSYICTKVIEDFSLEIKYFEANVLVTNPLGQSTIVNKLIRNCPLAFGEHVFLADLLLLSFHEFDASLGLDWLTRHNTMVDCRTRSVRLVNAESKEIVMFGKQIGLVNKIISAVIVQGEDANLSCIMDTSESMSEISQVPVVREFIDVFPGEFPEIPTEREI
ncbi:uncharacterized protein [Gossypium hirsutum]|uniref:Uncharacterized protein n=1 Tax=Gossypium hirsutum TaxID=3635 RepID=A0A1U8NVV6_GOSHI|nr:uncharacterized protein LOC107952231 [Gossypium hirsutum]